MAQVIHYQDNTNTARILAVYVAENRKKWSLLCIFLLHVPFHTSPELLHDSLHVAPESHTEVFHADIQMHDDSVMKKHPCSR